jgi:hypothetical protein
MPWPFVFAHILSAAGSAILLIRGFAPFLTGAAAIEMALDRIDLSFVRIATVDMRVQCSEYWLPTRGPVMAACPAKGPINAMLQNPES